jgi:hypothetical protein
MRRMRTDVTAADDWIDPDPLRQLAREVHGGSGVAQTVCLRCAADVEGCQSKRRAYTGDSSP